MNDLKFWKFLVIVNGSVPVALLAWDAWNGRLGADPTNFALHTTGWLSLLFLTLSLAVTPLRRISGWNAIVGFRRALGLFGFFYACVHLLIYVAFDQAMDLAGAANEIWMRRFLQIGMLAVVLMIPLAFTSTTKAISWMGAKRWKLLHRLAYVVAGLAVIHFLLLVKADLREPLIFAGVLGGLMFARAGWHYYDLRKAASAGKGTAPIATLPPRKKFWSGELRLARIFEETPDVKTFRLVDPAGGALPFDYAPGQYLNLQLDVDGQTVHRSYTIASTPTRCGYCEVTVKREAQGTASRFLHDRLKEGDLLRVSAPAGRFVFRGDETNAVVLIAGGVGVTPMMSIVRYLTDRGWPGEIHFLIGVRTTADLIFAEEIASLEKRFPRLRVHRTFSRVEEETDAGVRRGRVDLEWFRACVPEPENKVCFVCGPQTMMDAVCDVLREAGTPEEFIRTEAFVSPALSLHRTDSEGALEAAVTQEAPDGREAASLDVMAATAAFRRSARSATVDAGMTLLEAGESIGLELPYECRSGVCGQCKTRLLAGSVTMRVDAALSASEKMAGYVLTCQARPLQDVTLDA